MSRIVFGRGCLSPGGVILSGAKYLSSCSARRDYPCPCSPWPRLGEILRPPQRAQNDINVVPPKLESPIALNCSRFDPHPPCFSFVLLIDGLQARAAYVLQVRGLKSNVFMVLNPLS